MPHALSCDKRIFVVYTIQRTFNAVVAKISKMKCLRVLEEVEEGS